MTGMAEQAAGAGLSFNPWDENFRRNPYSFYQPLRMSPPPVLRFFIPVAIVSRYGDVLATLRDQERFSSIPVRNRMTTETNEVFGDAPSIVNSDPPIHTRLRKLVSRDFTPRAIRELEPRVRALTTGLLDEVAHKRHFDLVADFAIPLPVRIIASILGIPGERYETFKRWSDTLIELTSLPPGTPMADSVRVNLTEMRGYFAEEIERRRRHPGTDLMSSLVSAHEDTEMLSAGELMQFLVILLIAGNETTTNLIGNGMLALQQHPEQMALFAPRPDSVAARDRGNAALRQPGAIGFPHREGGRRNRRHPDRERQRGFPDDRVGQSRSGGSLSRSRCLRHHARRERPSLIRRGDPLLPRRAARASRSGGRIRHHAQSFPATAARWATAAGLQDFVFRSQSEVAADDRRIR